MRLMDARPKRLRAGVIVPPELQVNETTLRQHQARLAATRVVMTPSLARRCGYAEAEIAEVFADQEETDVR